MSGGAASRATLDATVPFILNRNNKSTPEGGSGSAKLPAPGTVLLNRGLGGEGLFLDGRKDYAGFLFAKSASMVKTELTLSLVTWYESPPSIGTQRNDSSGGDDGNDGGGDSKRSTVQTVLAEVTVEVPAGKCGFPPLTCATCRVCEWRTRVCK